MEESGSYILVLYTLHRNTVQEAALSCLDTYYLVVYFSNKEIQIKKENLILSIICMYIYMLDKDPLQETPLSYGHLLSHCLFF